MEHLDMDDLFLWHLCLLNGLIHILKPSTLCSNGQARLEHENLLAQAQQHVAMQVEQYD